MSDQRLARYVLLAPALLATTVFVVTPLILTTIYSFRSEEAWSLRNFHRVLTTEPYFTVFWNSMSIASVTTVSALLLAIPACAYFARPTSSSTGLFLAVVTLALTVSLLIRTYAWQVLLAYNGIFNDLALALGITRAPVRLLYSKAALFIVLTQVMLPYACLVLFTSMRQIDWDLIRAAQTLGAGPLKTFWSAYWPQIKNSVVTAALIVFTGSAGAYVTPALIGGPSETMLGMQIYSDLVINYTEGNGLAAASGTVLGIVLLAFTGLAMLATRNSFVHAGERNS